MAQKRNRNREEHENESCSHSSNLELLSMCTIWIISSSNTILTFPRLRLGVYTDQDGDKLAIYYKMFTSRPVIDLCASSPRQYTHQATKRPVLIHTKNISLPEPQSEQRYTRSDNNQWRVVAWDSLRSTFCMVKRQVIWGHFWKSTENRKLIHKKTDLILWPCSSRKHLRIQMNKSP